VRNYTIAVGSPFETAGGGNAGTVWIFKTPNGTAEEDYLPQEQLIPDASAGGDELGSQVYLDFSRVVVAGPSKNLDQAGANHGGAWTIDYNETLQEWNETGLFAPSDLEGSDEFGSSMIVQANFLALGGPRNNGDVGSNAGAAYAYWYNATDYTWVAIQKLVPDETVPEDKVGSAVGLYCDSLFVGAEGDEGNTGTVYWYNKNQTFAEEVACVEETVPGCAWWNIFCWFWRLIFGAPAAPESTCPVVFDPCL